MDWFQVLSQTSEEASQGDEEALFWIKEWIVALSVIFRHRIAYLMELPALKIHSHANIQIRAIRTAFSNMDIPFTDDHEGRLMYSFDSVLLSGNATDAVIAQLLDYPLYERYHDENYSRAAVDYNVDGIGQCLAYFTGVEMVEHEDEKQRQKRIADLFVKTIHDIQGSMDLLKWLPSPIHVDVVVEIEIATPILREWLKNVEQLDDKQLTELCLGISRHCFYADMNVLGDKVKSHLASPREFLSRNPIAWALVFDISSQLRDIPEDVVDQLQDTYLSFFYDDDDENITSIRSVNSVS
jgi:hypothetical protein